MGLAEKIQGPPRTRFKNRQKSDPSYNIIPFASPRPKPLSLAERFKHPIVRVNIQTGQVEINELREYWSEEGITRG